MDSQSGMYVRLRLLCEPAARFDIVEVSGMFSKC